MQASPNRQTRKRLATRQKISDIATRLFIERGFDKVRIEEIAEAADVSRMTVFNHFARKEDLFFDLDEAAREDLIGALQHKNSATSPIEAVRLFAHWAIENQRPYVQFYSAGSDAFMGTIHASEALKSRARAIRDEISDTLTSALAMSVNQPPSDPAASLAATLLVATWAVALNTSHRSFQHHHSIQQANKAFLEIVDRGAKGVESALEGTPYVEPSRSAAR